MVKMNWKSRFLGGNQKIGSFDAIDPEKGFLASIKEHQNGS